MEIIPEKPSILNDKSINITDSDLSDIIPEDLDFVN